MQLAVYIKRKAQSKIATNGSITLYLALYVNIIMIIKAIILLSLFNSDISIYTYIYISKTEEERGNK